MTKHHDDIGRSYARTRQPHPRIARQLCETLGDASSVVNVGAGTGLYELVDREVTAIEPSLTMIGQRPAGNALLIQGVAEALPLRDNSVDAALAILTIHHWSNPLVGFSEMRRVARGPCVILTWDQEIWGKNFWMRG